MRLTQSADCTTTNLSVLVYRDTKATRSSAVNEAVAARTAIVPELTLALTATVCLYALRMDRAAVLTLSATELRIDLSASARLG